MRLLELNVQGYRSLKNVQWKPGDLNVVIGPNGSGKSNLLRVIELLSASASGKLNDFIQREGGMLSILWDGQANKVIIRLALNEPQYYENHIYSYDLRFHAFRGMSSAINMEYLSIAEPGVGSERILIEKNPARVIVSGAEKRSLIPTSDGESVLSQEGSQYGADFEIYEVKTHLINSGVYQDISFQRASVARLPQVTRFEQKVNPDGQNLITVLHTLYTSDRDFKSNINEAMRAAFGADFDEIIFPPAADQRIQMRVRWKTLKREQSAADLSDGTLRFLFLITVLASPEPPPLIAIDEPETGLHPSMMPIIAEYAVEAARRTQVIFTTHSAAFLDAFRGEERPTITVARWEDGETKLQIVDDDELKRFLERYTLGELYRSGELESEFFAE